MTTSLPRTRTTRRTTEQPRTAPPRSQAPTPPRSAAERSAPQPSGPAAVVAVKKLFGAETGNFFILLFTTGFLVVFGLIMVLSSSSVESYLSSGDFFNGFLRQVLFAAIGFPAMLLAARMPMAFWKRWAGVFVLAAVGLQLLVFVPHLGIEVGGNRNWIRIGGFTAQPSELIKVTLAVWLGWTLSKRAEFLDDWRDLARRIVPIAGAALGLVLLGGDFGTVIILASIVFGALFFAGVKLVYLALPTLGIALIGLVVAFGTSSRKDRIAAFMNGCASGDSYSTSCWQTVHGWWALAAGGLFGVGLGNSKAKWSWLPEADNDFIFAIIGEELGLIGAIVVLGLFIVLAITFVRIIRANNDPFAKITIASIMVWIIGQAFVNIGVVLGVLPVLGVPLPLISAGGSALVTTMLAIGIVLSFARHAPEPAL